MRYLSLILTALLLAGCTDPQAEERQKFAETLNGMVGMTERALIRRMLRIPDAERQLDPSTKALLWRLDVTTTTRGTASEFVWTGGVIKEIPGRPATSSTAFCNVQWIVIDGTARSYSTTGSGCP